MPIAALPSQVRVRNYRPEDEAQLLEVWSAALLSDPINATWRAKVLLDPNFDSAGYRVAEVDDRVCGFLLSFTRKIPCYDEDLAPDGGWITTFAVHPAWQRRGVGTTLLSISARSAYDRICVIVGLARWCSR
jgi:ribosomal protein S18 acetylase RimI-like enzyme